MWRIGKWRLAALVLTVCFGTASAQSSRILLLKTNLPDAAVYADSIRLGQAERGAFQVPVEADSLRLLPGNGGEWSIAPVAMSLRDLRRDTVEVELDFPHYYRIESVPYGADVFIRTMDGRERIGTTPLLHVEHDALTSRLVVEKQGYRPEEIVPGHQVWNRYVVTLEPQHAADMETAEVDWSPPHKTRRWIDYTAAAVALAAGALSVHYKFKADRRYDDYLETGDPSLRSGVKANDTRSAVALGVMQAGLGVLAVRFVLR